MNLLARPSVASAGFATLRARTRQLCECNLRSHNSIYLYTQAYSRVIILRPLVVVQQSRQVDCEGPVNRRRNTRVSHSQSALGADHTETQRNRASVRSSCDRRHQTVTGYPVRVQDRRNASRFLLLRGCPVGTCFWVTSQDAAAPASWRYSECS